MNIRTLLICVSALGLASPSRATSISYAVLDHGELSAFAYVAGYESNLVKAVAGRSDHAVDLGTRHSRIHQSRIAKKNTHTTDKGDYAASSLPPTSSTDLQDSQTPNFWANVQAVSNFPWYNSSLWLNESALWAALFTMAPGHVSQLGDGHSFPGPMYLGTSPEIGASGYLAQNQGETSSEYTHGFAAITAAGNNAQTPGDVPLSGCQCFTWTTSSYVPSGSKYQLQIGADDFSGFLPIYRPQASPVRNVAMSEPDTAILFIVDLAFLAAVVTFLRSKLGEKKTRA